MKLTDLDIRQQQDVINNVSQKTGLSPVSIEKDWWVVQVLRALFELPYSKSLSFKGGTSLSKCWHLIERFSEDVDIAIDREYLGFDGELSKTQISDKLRRASCSFVRERLKHDLREQLVVQGLDGGKFDVTVNITPVTTTDPEVISINYRSLFQPSGYIADTVKIEVSGRSMNDPVAPCAVRSLIDEQYPDAAFAEPPIVPRAVSAERTFLEKLFLMHEELAKPTEQIRVSRMSRHLYDLAMMSKAGVADKALGDENLYRRVVEHRRKFIGLKDFNYDTLYPSSLKIVPPESISEQWREDYRIMEEQMVYGKAPDYDSLMAIITLLNEQVAALQIYPHGG
ncbi:MAG: nucleotidyl transferase AbiEii/AbiGii toxin family protein [Bacteroidales bacterium]|nr:nucleotidyl transferase AbiEii/AbiGii toxin family protein [Bacteroidales bacterium]